MDFKQEAGEILHATARLVHEMTWDKIEALPWHAFRVRRVLRRAEARAQDSLRLIRAKLRFHLVTCRAPCPERIKELRDMLLREVKQVTDALSAILSKY